jgi:hypothetical protein
MPGPVPILAWTLDGWMIALVVVAALLLGLALVAVGLVVKPPRRRSAGVPAPGGLDIP